MPTSCDLSAAGIAPNGGVAPNDGATPEADGRRERPILFFDGECTMCNAAVDFCLKRSDDLLFAPLQGETATAKLAPGDRDLNSVVLLQPSGEVFRRSTASLEAAKTFGGVWPLLASLGLLVPRFLRDGVYRVIAKNRYRWFGRRDKCRLPTPDEASRFLP